MKDLELNKITASILLAGLIAMLCGFFTDIFYKSFDLRKLFKKKPNNFHLGVQSLVQKSPFCIYETKYKQLLW